MALLAQKEHESDHLYVYMPPNEHSQDRPRRGQHFVRSLRNTDPKVKIIDCLESRIGVLGTLVCYAVVPRASVVALTEPFHVDTKEERTPTRREYL